MHKGNSSTKLIAPGTYQIRFIQVDNAGNHSIAFWAKIT
jgi:hypothetical protein